MTGTHSHFVAYQSDRANADLNKRVRELQTELLTLKSENLRLAAQNTDLIHGRDVMQKEQEAMGNTMQAQASLSCFFKEEEADIWTRRSAKH